MRVAAYPGTPLPDMKRRMVGRGFWLPLLSTDGVTAASSVRLNATATGSAIAHTKGLWTEVIAATTKPVNYIVLTVTTATNTSATDSSALLDIGIGAALSEVVVVPNLSIGYKQVSFSYAIPIHIPLGSRVAIRCQGVETLKAITIEMTLCQLPFGKQAPNHLVAMGDNTTTSKGVAVAAATSTNTKQGWVQITASTTEPFSALILGLQADSDTIMTGHRGLVDIGVGASGSEVVLVPDIPIGGNTAEAIRYFCPVLFPVDVPLGSRLAVRWACTTTSDTLDVILHGVPRG